MRKIVFLVNVDRGHIFAEVDSADVVVEVVVSTARFGMKALEARRSGVRFSAGLRPLVALIESNARLR